MVGACQCGSRGSECVTAILFWPFMVSLLGGGTRTHAHVLALRPTPKAERIDKKISKDRRRRCRRLGPQIICGGAGPECHCRIKAPDYKASHQSIAESILKQGLKPQDLRHTRQGGAKRNCECVSFSAGDAFIIVNFTAISEGGKSETFHLRL